MFVEYQTNAFDFSRTQCAHTNNELLRGVLLSLGTMCENEESEFIIDYKLMFGEIGAPPRIPARADILLVVKLKCFQVIDVEEVDSLPRNRNRFPRVYKKTIELQRNALYNFDNKQYSRSMEITRSAIESLELCRLANQDEELSQRVVLVELYTHLMDCYNKLEDWKQTCSMVEELKRLCNINQNASVMLKHGLALVHSGEFDRGLKTLLKAQALVPNDDSVTIAVKGALETRDKYDREVKAMWKRAFN